jgi:predicted DNA-binding WGR domain protein
MSIVRKEKFIFVESAENHNKFWYIEEHDNGLIKTIWGRVGNKESTSEKQFGSNAGKEYDKLVKSKLKKGYTRLQTLDSEITFTSGGGISKQSLESIALSEIDYDKANDTITKMIKTFCAENIHTITANTSITFNSDTNVFQTPCGIVTIESINDARDILSEIAAFVEQRDFCTTFIKKTEEYCTLIPQKIKGKFDPCRLFFNMYDVNRQSDILDSLEDSIKIINDFKEGETMTTKEYQERSALRIFLSYFKPHKKLFLLDMLCALTISVIDLAFPYVSRWCMNELLPHSVFRTFWTVMAVMLVAYAIRSVLMYIILQPKALQTSAMWRVPSTLMACTLGRFASSSAASTAVQAAQWITASGFTSFSTRLTDAASVMSIWT